MSRRRTIPVDICFVLDATGGNQSIFMGMIDQVSKLEFDIKEKNRAVNVKFGGVIMRDPVDWKPLPPEQLPDEDIREHEMNIREERRRRLVEAGLWDEDLENHRAENERLYDREKYPFDQNVPIPIKDNIENLEAELFKVECGGGNDQPEDWAGAIRLALDLNWREKSKKIIILISDANAHGNKFCGYDNHNDQEDILTNLTQTMAHNNFIFIGINIIKGVDEGCKTTLNEMKTIYDQTGGIKFISAEFRPIYNVELFGEDNWPQNVLENFMEAIITAMDQLGRLDDSDNED